jgi:hypothetical protein
LTYTLKKARRPLLLPKLAFWRAMIGFCNRCKQVRHIEQ